MAIYNVVEVLFRILELYKFTIVTSKIIIMTRINKKKVYIGLKDIPLGMMVVMWTFHTCMTWMGLFMYTWQIIVTSVLIITLTYLN